MPIFLLWTTSDFNRDHHLRRSHLGSTCVDFIREAKETTLFLDTTHNRGDDCNDLQYLHIGPILEGCYSLEVPRLFTFYAVPPFVTAVIMFLMTLHKCGATCLSLGPGRTPIIALFLRDGVFWFLALVLVSVVEIVLWDRARPTLAQIPVVPAISLIAVIGARVVLNIKQISLNADMDMGVATVAEPEMDTVPQRRERTERIPWYLRTNDTATSGKTEMTT
ncbi:hypothetical protein B0H16DRAFT_707945 [Mycena metata]|uniref:Uncharacterized protein n=1 Tax=Mycena metata TaxID=1033252 RepID=A0AAD7J2U3_9AGAR|nr:hypothetical protein B0H16DRAFT_707945 [Mycena metata]